MGVGKYSPVCPYAHEIGWSRYRFNSEGNPPEDWPNPDVKYNERTMFADFDEEGYDSYGYSAFDADGNFVGVGKGVDRCGYTEMDYLIDSGSGGDLYETASITNKNPNLKERK